MRYHGTVSRLQLNPGSKSAHSAVVLVTSDGPLKLRRAGGNPFADRELDRLVGLELDCEGQVHQGQLILENWRIAGGPR
jgi:hypothetical protein